jgi:Ca2+-binding RTX toxin-like protein
MLLPVNVTNASEYIDLFCNTWNHFSKIGRSLINRSLSENDAMTNKIIAASIIAGLAAIMAVSVGVSYGGGPAVPICDDKVNTPVYDAGTGFYVVEGTQGPDIIDCKNQSVNLLINGGKGNDIISSGTGDDELGGNEGNDTLRGGDGADTLKGHNGADYIICGDGDGDTDTVEGGNGIDATESCQTDNVSLGRQK